MKASALTTVVCAAHIFLGQCLSGASWSKGPADVLIDAQVLAGQMEVLKGQVQELVPRVSAGGRKARAALIRLISLATEPNAAQIMKTAGVEAAASKLMKSVQSSEEIQRLAGSVLTLLTSMPVTSEISDEKTGSYGRVHIVVPRPSRVYRPDATALELSSGVAPSETDAGY